MGMIPGTFLVVDNAPPPTQNVAPATQPPAGQKYPALEAYRQRFIHEAKQLWQRLESFYQDVLTGKQ